jgi:hypothetical protein
VDLAPGSLKIFRVRTSAHFGRAMPQACASTGATRGPGYGTASSGEWMWPRVRLLACRELALAAFPTLNPMRARYGGALVVLGEDDGLGGGLPSREILRDDVAGEREA